MRTSEIDKELDKSFPKADRGMRLLEDNLDEEQSVKEDEMSIKKRVSSNLDNESVASSFVVVTKEQIFDMLVTSFDDDDRERKKLLRQAKRKVWRVVRKIKENKKKYQLEMSRKKWYIFDPTTSLTRKLIDYFYVFLLMFDYFITPYFFFCNHRAIKNNKFIGEKIFDCFFFIEIIINFFTGYFDYSLGYTITDSKKIAIHYLKYGFFFDLLAIVPFYLSKNLMNHGKSGFYLTRLIKLYRYPRCLERIRVIAKWVTSIFIINLKIRQQTVQFLLFAISVIYILHICSCILAYLGLYFQEGKEKTWCDIYFPKEIDDYMPIKVDANTLYINSMHLITQTFTTTGYGDIYPYNIMDILFIMFCQIVNCGLFSYLLACIIEIITNRVNSVAFKYQNTEISIKRWILNFMDKLPRRAKKKNLHRDDIWDDAKRYFYVHYQTEKNFSWITRYPFLKQLRPNDRRNLLEKAFYKIRQKFSLFSLIKSDITKQNMIVNFQTIIETSGFEIIPFKGEIDKIYFIDQGSVTASGVGVNAEISTTLEEGEVFGLECLVEKYSKFSYCVGNNCEFVILFAIDVKVLFEDILNYDGEAYTDLKKYALKYIKKMQKDYKLPKGVEKEEEEEIKKVENALPYVNENAGNLLKKEKELEKLRQYEQTLDEYNDRLDLVQKQVTFYKKYLDKVL